ncbi:MAG: hypothetical protein M1832_000226 [Thelocarpon impressellum]|nr:MAG: hypothetical protein M1832_000226 [Thelocarpon impressellum]
MYITSRPLRLFRCLALLAAAARAEFLEENLSFGYKEPLSPNLRAIPGWNLQGDGPTPPQLLSDRVVLTPPYPGNQRAALWGDHKMQDSEWSADVEFRATGPERGGGNLQIWYAKDGRSEVGTASIYTVRKFDGLVLVVDTHGGRGGSIRGFLNDGSTDYKGHHNIDSLAFGHCDYPYRNLGRPSKVQVRQSGRLFEVRVDDKACFKSEKVKLPTDYYFGVSAASAENPDSFEAYKFVVTTLGSGSSSSSSSHEEQHAPRQERGSGSQDTLLLELQQQLKSVAQKLDTLETLARSVESKANERHQELASKGGSSSEQIGGLEGRLGSIERTLQAIQRDVSGRDYKKDLDALSNAIELTHANLMTHLPASMNDIVLGATPHLGAYVFWIVVVQLCAALAYYLYKRRRANAPKKYL